MAETTDSPARKAKEPAAPSPAALAQATGGHPRDTRDLHELTPDEARRAYRTMLTIRRFEEKAGQLFAMGLVGGYCHLCIGQEAVVAGVRMASADGDTFIATHRNHGHLIACGVPLGPLMAELVGRAAGVCGGKGGSMHMFAPAARFYGGHGIVGAPAPLAAGLAFASRYRGDGGVCWCSIGDGAADQGQVAEALVLAARWSLPVVFVIENNQCASADPDAQVHPACDLSRRGLPCDIPGQRVDGMDVRAVRDAACRAGQRARTGEGPSVLEMLTVRFRGHSMADPGRYRTVEEAQEARRLLDPIERAKTRMLALGQATEDDLRDIDRAVRAEVSRAADFGRDSPEPPAAALATDVVAGETIA